VNVDYIPVCSTADYDADSMETDRTRRCLTDNESGQSTEIHEYTENQTSMLNNDTEHSDHSYVSVIAINAASSADSKCVKSFHMVKRLRKLVEYIRR